jgi:hypothetical protein
MKRVIDGLRYDTKTATKVEAWSNDLPSSDFGSCEETLYRTKNGRYFIYGDGGAMTRWATPVGNNGWGGGSGIVPVAAAEALSWLEDHGLEVPDGCPEIAELVQDA